MKNTIHHFLAFLKSPVDVKQERTSFGKKIGDLLFLMVIDLPVAGIFIGIMYVLEYFGLLNQEDHKLADMMDQMGMVGMLVLGVLLMPLLEEFIFRLYLRYQYNPWFRFRELVVRMDHQNEEDRIEPIARLKARYQKIYPYLFYFSAILFGLVHLFNFKINLTYILLAPVLVGPQIMAGLIAGYLRVQYNVWIGYLYHAFSNAIFLALPIAFFSFFVETGRYENGNQRLEIRETMFTENTNFSSNDSVNLGCMRLQSTLAYFTDRQEDAYEFADKSYADKKVNLVFKKVKGDKQLDFNWAHERVLEHFQLRAEKKHRTRTVYVLMVADTEMLYLNKHAKNEHVSHSKIYNGTLECQNTSMYEFCRKLSEHSGQKIIDQTFEGDTYDFALSSNDIKSIQLELLEDYGLILQSRKEEMDYYVISKDPNGK